MLSLSKYDTEPPFDRLRVTRLSKGLKAKRASYPIKPHFYFFFPDFGKFIFKPIFRLIRLKYMKIMPIKDYGPKTLFPFSWNADIVSKTRGSWFVNNATAGRRVGPGLYACVSCKG